MTQKKDLFEPFRFRNGIWAPNRLALAALTNSQSHADGTLSDNELHWLNLRAEGGFGIVTSCAAHVSKLGQGWPGALGVSDDAQLPGLTRFAHEMHQRKSLALMQIFHGGLRADQTVCGGQPISASDGGPTGARAATEHDLEQVIEDFAQAAVRAHAAKMDGIEIHGAHGYLFTQFLSTTENHRTDQWGGSYENRARLLRRTMQAVRARVPKDFVVGVRISPEDGGNARGIDLDESLQLAKWLADDGIDFLHMSLWDAFKPSIKRPAEHPLDIFKRVIPADLPIFAAGHIWDRNDAQKVLDLGADVIALGRSAILNPNWPKDIIDPAWQPKRLPTTSAHLLSVGLQPVFINRLKPRPGFIAD